MSKADAARANGAKSQGPTSTEGKARSAQNSLQHGLTSNTVVLRTESKEEYDQLLFDYIRLYQPVGPIEHDLVHEIAATRWRLRRILRIETAAFDQAIERAAEENPEMAETAAFETLTASSQTLSTLNRYEGRLRRAYERATTELRHIQAARAAVQNEPTAHRKAPQATQRTLASNEYHPANNSFASSFASDDQPCLTTDHSSPVLARNNERR